MRVLTIWFPGTFPAVNPPQNLPHLAFPGTVLCFLILCLCSTFPHSHSSVRTFPSFQVQRQSHRWSPPLQAGLLSLPLHSLSSWHMAVSLPGRHTPSNTLLTSVFLTQLSPKFQFESIFPVLFTISAQLPSFSKFSFFISKLTMLTFQD